MLGWRSADYGDWEVIAQPCFTKYSSVRSILVWKTLAMVSTAHPRSSESHTSLRFALKAATADLHERAERNVDRLAIFETPSAYQHWLGAMLRLHERFADSTTKAALVVGLEPISEMLIEALRADLGLLEDSAAANAHHSTDRLDEQLGVLYVFEGSGLGARLLCERAYEHQVSPVGFLERSRDLAVGRWPQVARALNKHASDPDVDIDSAAAAANEVFEFLLETLPQPPSRTSEE